MQSAPNEKIRYRSECQQIRPQKGGSDSVPFAKKIGTSITCSDMVAGAGFEPHDLRVMSSKEGVLYRFANSYKVLILCGL